MNNIKHDLDDSLRPEYRRADFGEMIQGKYATTEIEFAELVRVLLACIGEDEDLKFVPHSSESRLADHRTGDWTYEIDTTNQITLRYWHNELISVEGVLSSPCCVTTPEGRAELQNQLRAQVRILKAQAAR